MIVMERLSTGINGLDEKMQGGFVRGSINLVTGKTGTGKTAFCSSFLYEGTQKNEPGVYLTTEEPEADIKDDIKSMFNWDIEEIEKKLKVPVTLIGTGADAEEIIDRR
jgi:KaiC/GvpD/RAD55 family RecA-like ATPase